MQTMKNTVAIVDYGMGNLRSVWQAVQAAAADSSVQVQVTHDPAVVHAASRVVLPGQGAMRDCMAALRHSGLEEAVRQAAASKPLFGVCVGMQMLLEHSEEGDTPALGLIPGQVRRFDLAGQRQADGSRFKVPQMGWNQVWQTRAWRPTPSAVGGRGRWQLFLLCTQLLRPAHAGRRWRGNNRVRLNVYQRRGPR